MSFPATHELYDKLSDTAEGVINISSFYASLCGEKADLRDLQRRLEDVSTKLEYEKWYASKRDVRLR